MGCHVDILFYSSNEIIYFQQLGGVFNKNRQQGNIFDQDLIHAEKKLFFSLILDEIRILSTNISVYSLFHSIQMIVRKGSINEQFFRDNTDPIIQKIYMERILPYINDSIYRVSNLSQKRF